MRRLVIAGREIRDDAPCYVIAEIGGNHGGDVEAAKALIRMAARAGASAVKLQKRDNATLYTSRVLQKPYEHEHSYGPTYGAHRAHLEFGQRAYCECIVEAEKAGVPLFATAFDEPSVAFLAELGVPAIKIHSGGLTDRPLLKAAKSAQVPIILSTGASTLADIDQAVQCLGDTPHAILHCTASYPLRPEEANLRAILTLRDRYPETVIGFSTHSPGLAFSLVAYGLGARIIEHHVTLNRAGKGTDHAFSLEPKGLETLMDDLNKCHLALGTGAKVVYPSELAPIGKMRRRATSEGWRIDG